MATLLKRKPKSVPEKEKSNAGTQKAPLLKVPDERPVPGADRPRQTEKSYLAFTIQRKHDGVTNLYELVVVRVEDGKVVKEVRRDPGTMREIVESKIFRDLSEIVF